MIEDRYIATMLLHALGDTIGFNNGFWEFNYFTTTTITYDMTLEILYDFISMGGINDIDISDWRVSDDTIMHMAVAKSLISKNTISEYRKNFTEAIKSMMKDSEKDKERFMGNMIKESYNYLVKNKTMKYYSNSGGNGVAMRNHCLGLAYHRKEDLDDLIEKSIETGKLTHTSPIGYLGGLVSALFTSYAIQDIDINTWPFKLMKVLKSKEVTSYIKTYDEQTDYNTFLSYWKKYIDIRFDKNEMPIFTRSDKNLVYRTKLFTDNFTSLYNQPIGISGYSSMIMAYDCLLCAGDKFEKVLIYSAIHNGDSDTVGAITCGLYGALYGFKNVPERLLKHLEFKEDLINSGKKIYKKFN
jgi:ADP-ribosylarginine hydrolase